MKSKNLSFSGIYQIVNIINDMKYVGSAKNIRKRFANHKWLLNNDKHPNTHLQRAWTRYGKDKFRFYIIEKTNKNNLIKAEQQYLCFLNRSSFYNICPVAGNTTGKYVSKRTREKLAAIQKGRSPSKATREKLSQPLRKYIYCPTDGNIYFGAKEASKKTGASLTGIYETCSGKNKHAKGYVFRYIDGGNCAKGNDI